MLITIPDEYQFADSRIPAFSRTPATISRLFQITVNRSLRKVLTKTETTRPVRRNPGPRLRHWDAAFLNGRELLLPCSKFCALFAPQADRRLLRCFRNNPSQSAKTVRAGDAELKTEKDRPIRFTGTRSSQDPSEYFATGRTTAKCHVETTSRRF